MTPAKLNVNYVKGDSHQIRITGCPEVDKMYMTVRCPLGNMKFQKRYYFSGEESDGIIKEEDGSYLITINPSDTDNLKIQKYNFDVEIIINTIKLTILKGSIKLEDEYTYRRNEV